MLLVVWTAFTHVRTEFIASSEAISTEILNASPRTIGRNWDKSFANISMKHERACSDAYSEGDFLAVPRLALPLARYGTALRAFAGLLNEDTTARIVEGMVLDLNDDATGSDRMIWSMFDRHKNSDVECPTSSGNDCISKIDLLSTASAGATVGIFVRGLRDDAASTNLGDFFEIKDSNGNVLSHIGNGQVLLDSKTISELLDSEFTIVITPLLDGDPFEQLMITGGSKVFSMMAISANVEANTT